MTMDPLAIERLRSQALERRDCDMRYVASPVALRCSAGAAPGATRVVRRRPPPVGHARTPPTIADSYPPGTPT